MNTVHKREQTLKVHKDLNEGSGIKKEWLDYADTKAISNLYLATHSIIFVPTSTYGGTFYQFQVPDHLLHHVTYADVIYSVNLDCIEPWSKDLKALEFYVKSLPPTRDYIKLNGAYCRVKQTGPRDYNQKAGIHTLDLVNAVPITVFSPSVQRDIREVFRIIRKHI